MRGPGARRALKIIVTETAVYRNLFNEASDQKAVGEASTVYLYSPTAPAHIRHHIPDAGLIAILRNPIDRAYSAYVHARHERHGRAKPLSDSQRPLPQ